MIEPTTLDTVMRNLRRQRRYDELRELVAAHPEPAMAILDDWLASARTTLGTLKAEVAAMRSQSFAGEITRAEFHQFEADTKQRLVGVESLIRNSGRLRQYAQNQLGIRNRAEKAAAHDLREAIREHFEACRDADIEPESHDVKLWATVGLVPAGR